MGDYLAGFGPMWGVVEKISGGILLLFHIFKHLYVLEAERGGGGVIFLCHVTFRIGNIGSITFESHVLHLGVDKDISKHAGKAVLKWQQHALHGGIYHLVFWHSRVLRKAGVVSAIALLALVGSEGSRRNFTLGFILQYCVGGINALESVLAVVEPLGVFVGDSSIGNLLEVVFSQSFLRAIHLFGYGFIAVCATAFLHKLELCHALVARTAAGGRCLEVGNLKAVEKRLK